MYNSIDDQKFSIRLHSGVSDVDFANKVNDNLVNYFIKKLKAENCMVNEREEEPMVYFDFGGVAKVKDYNCEDIKFRTYLSNGIGVITFDKDFECDTDSFVWAKEILKEFYTEEIYKLFEESEHEKFLDVSFIISYGVEFILYEPISAVKIGNEIITRNIYDIKKFKCEVCDEI